MPRFNVTPRPRARLSCRHPHCFPFHSRSSAAAELLIAYDGATGFLLGGVVGFIGEHPLLGAAAATPFLAANLLNAVALSRDITLLQGFDLIKQ